MDSHNEARRHVRFAQGINMVEASTAKYVPGKGLDRGANARLRARQAWCQCQNPRLLQHPGGPPAFQSYVNTILFI